MNRVKLIPLMLLILIISNVYSQSIEEIKNDREQYIWGEGVGVTLRAADQIALSELIGQISTHVESNFDYNYNSQEGESVDIIINTYSSATLHNTEKIIISNEPDAKVFRFVKRTDIDKIFKSRETKIIELAKSGEKALEDYRIADAIRYLYWSQTLLRSHPDKANIKFYNRTGEEVSLLTWLPSKINEIFAKVSVKVKSIENKGNYDLGLLTILYNKTPVLNLDYSYWSGQNWSNIISAKDGLGYIEMPDMSQLEKIQFKVEYAFEGEANIDLELRDVMKKLPVIPYRNSYINIPVIIVEEKVEEKDAEVVAVTDNQPTEETYAVHVSESNKKESINWLDQVNEYDTKMHLFIDAILQNNYDEVKPLFSENGYDIYSQLLKYGNAQILNEVELKYLPYGDYVICRSVPMRFKFDSNDKEFIEDVVFYFDKDMKICNLTFGLSSDALTDILAKSVWNEEDRITLVNFLENYKTAYALKRLDYIEQIFSDDALIITGYVVKNSKPNEVIKENKIINYNRQTKEQYVKRLRYTFAGNEYINIRFADNSVRRSGKNDSIYGIQIKQDYYSTNYGDSGYLFLMVDLTKKDEPLIHVRTWQPEKNENGSIYGLSDF